MSMRATCDNNSLSTPIVESENDDENELDSSLNRHNESMMHKVKDVVSKFLHPSFLFTTNTESESSKRKRSASVEPTTVTRTTTTTTSKSNNVVHRSSIEDEEARITDDEEETTPVIEHEQQTKRRRTGNYQHILSTKPTNGHQSDLTTTNSFRSLSNQTVHPITATKRFDILPTYRSTTSNYDPTKSPLFSAGIRKTNEPTNLKSTEFSANYLLANSLVTNSSSSPMKSQSTVATLSNPNANRSMFSSSINSRRLPYIERLRRRTLQDSIRLNRTVDSEPLSTSVIEERQTTTTTTTTASPIPKRTKVVEKECGIQCDILPSENSVEKIKQRSFPPANIRDEALSIPLQTNSSITIEPTSPSAPIVDLTKPKVLGNITPFSWPKFARAQEEYAKNYPDKCRVDTSPKVSVVPPVQQPKSTIFPFTPLRPVEAIWKCPTCTKEHPAQTATCSVCRAINQNYKKPSAIEKESNLPKTIASSIVTTTKENVISFASPVSIVTTTPIIIKENPLPAPFSFPITPTVTTASSVTPSFSIAPIVSTPTTSVVVAAAVKVKETPVSSSSSTTPAFGVTTSISSFPKANPTFPSGTPVFGLSTTVTEPPKTTIKETPVATTSTTSTAAFGTTTSTIPTFQFGTPSSSTSATNTSTTPAVTTTTSTSTVPLFTFTPSAFSAVTSSTPFGSTTNAAPIITFPSTGTFTSSSSSSTAATTTTSASPVSFGTGTFGTTATSSPFGTSTFGTPSTATTTTTTTTPSFGTSAFTLAPTTSSGSTVAPFGTSAFTLTPTTSSSSTVAPFGTTGFSFAPSTATTPFGSGGFGLTPVSTHTSSSTTTTSAPTTSAFSSNPTSTIAPSFGTISSGFSPAPTATTTASSTSTIPAFGTISSGFSPAPAAAPTTITTTTTSTAPPAFGGFNFTPSTTSAAAAAPTTLAPFTFGAGSASTSSNSTTPAPSFGSTAPFGTTAPFGSSSSFGTITPFGTSTTTPAFGFGSPPSSSSPSPTPVFGAPPPALSAVSTASPFIFGGSSSIASPAISTTTTTIPPPLPSNPFANVPSDTINPFSVTESTSNSPAQRRQLVARRRVRPS